MKTLDVTYIIQGSAPEILAALSQTDLIEQWSGASAEMDHRPGGKFSLWDGDIHGINREVGPGKLVQDWKVANWPEYSSCTITWQEADGKTTVRLLHEQIPDDAYDSIAEGWDEYYFGPLKALVEQMNA